MQATKSRGRIGSYDLSETFDRDWVAEKISFKQSKWQIIYKAFKEALEIGSAEIEKQYKGIKGVGYENNISPKKKDFTFDKFYITQTFNNYPVEIHSGLKRKLLKVG